jgi:hypothetical protein
MLTATRADIAWLEGLPAKPETPPRNTPDATPTLIRMPGSLGDQGRGADPEVERRVRTCTEPLVMTEPVLGCTYEILATNLAGGLLRVVDASPLPSPSRTLVLDGPSPVGGSMRVWILPLARGPLDQEDLVRFRWTAVGAGTDPAALRTIVARLVGVELPQPVVDSTVGPDRVWVYDAERMTLRHISKQSWSGVRGPPSTRPTTPEMGAVNQTHRTDIRAMPPRGPARRSGVVAPVSMVPREEQPGMFVLQGVRRSMQCGWLSETHIAFTVPFDSAPPVDSILDVAVPGDPVLPGAIWVTGQVCRHRAHLMAGRVLCQVDLRRFDPLLPKSYRSLVDHWRVALQANPVRGSIGR